MTARASRSPGMPRRSAPVAARGTPPWLPIAIGLAVIVVIAAVVALALANPPAPSLAEPARVPTDVGGAVLPPFDASAADPAVGLPIPAISGTDLEGAPMRIGPDDGPMAIVVLAHWCAHCQAEVPVLVDYLASTGMPEGVRIVGLSTAIDAGRPNYPPSAWLGREGWTVPTLVDDATSTGLAALGITSFPGFVLVDANGTVVQRYTGEMSDEAFDQAVRALAP